MSHGVDHAEQIIARRDQDDQDTQSHEPRPQPAAVKTAAPGRSQQERDQDRGGGEPENDPERRRHRVSLKDLDRELLEADDVLELVEEAFFDVLRLAADAAQLPQRLLLLLRQVRGDDDPHVDELVPPPA